MGFEFGSTIPVKQGLDPQVKGWLKIAAAVLAGAVAGLTYAGQGPIAGIASVVLKIVEALAQ